MALLPKGGDPAVKMQSQSFGRTLTGVLEIGRRRFLIGLLLQVGIWAFCLAILAVIDLVIKEEPLISSIGLCGLFAVGTGCILTFMEGLNQFNIDLAVEISFGIPRRRALAVSWIVTLGSGAVTIALAALQEAIWFHGVTGGTGEAIVSNIPAWGWLCLVFLPGAASAFTMGILRRFGKTGGVVLWLAFMVLCQTPQLLEITSPDMMNVLAAVMPVFLPLVGLAVAVVGTLLLYRANAVITNR